jgi:deoxyribodipyrimidine photo-lyase
VAQDLSGLGIAFSDYKDQVLLDRDEVLTQQGQPYSVFTPYKRAWLQKLDAFQLKPYPVALYARHLAPIPVEERLPALEQLGLNAPTCRLAHAGGHGRRAAAVAGLPAAHAAYQEARDFPGRKGVSYLSVHLRFGTVSIRALAGLALQRPCKGMRAHRPGCPSWPGAISTS